MPLSGELIGRSEEIQRLKENLARSIEESRTHSRRKVCVVLGLGGVGKTQLCAAFVRRYQNCFSAIAWLNGESINTLGASILSFVERTQDYASVSASASPGNADATIKNLMDWLSHLDNRTWLLVFDGVDHDHQTTIDGHEQAYNVARYFPAADHGSILITSKNQGLMSLGTSIRLQH